MTKYPAIFRVREDGVALTFGNRREYCPNNPIYHDSSQAVLAHDTMCGLKRQSFWVMEQQAGAGGWDVVGVAPRPGELRLWAYQAVAHGANGVVFFRWRTARFGTE